MKHKSKDYDRYVTPQNTPNYILYTWLIGLSFFFIGLNSLILFFSYKAYYHETDYHNIVFAVVFILISPFIAKDDRRSHTGLGYTVGIFIALTVLTAIMSYYTDIWEIFIAYAVEVVCLGLVIVIYFVRKKRQIRIENKNIKTKGKK